MAADDEEPSCGASEPEDAPIELSRCRFCGCRLCSAEDHQGLCDNLERNGLLQPGSPLALAFRQVDRGDFVPRQVEEEWEGLAYVDSAVYLDFGAQISAPHVHAHALRLLLEGLPEAGSAAEAPLRILDLGSGSGFACAVLARALELMRPGCEGSRVLAVEHIPELAERARTNLSRSHGELLASGGPLELRCADARAVVLEPCARHSFDLVHCGCAVAPGEEAWLAEALAEGGRAVFPRGLTDEPQRLCLLQLESAGVWKLSETEVSVLYVPATSEGAQRARGDEWDEVVERCRRSAAAAFG